MNGLNSYGKKLSIHGDNNIINNKNSDHTIFYNKNNIKMSVGKFSIIHL